MLRKTIVFFLMLTLSSALHAATTIEITNTPALTNVKRLGLNLGKYTFYDSLILKNLASRNPGFEGMTYRSLVRCASGTATTCQDENVNTSWPADFWAGGTFESVYGTSKGRQGTIASNTARVPPSTGPLYTFGDAGTAPANGDYLVLYKEFPGGADVGWSPQVFGGASVTTELNDLPPGTDGRQCIRLNASSGGQAAINGGWGVFVGQTMLVLNGNFRLTFKARAAAAGQNIVVTLARGTSNFLNPTVALTPQWATYTYDFTASETSSVTGGFTMRVSAAAPANVLLDDISIVKTDGDATNTSFFRDTVVDTLREYRPGVLRGNVWYYGDTLDNLLKTEFGRQRAGWTAYGTFEPVVHYALPEFLDLCAMLELEPWFCIPITFTNEEVANFMEYLGGDTSTPYGARRAARGHPTPWTQVLRHIHLEYGNEAWNSAFQGATMLPAAYGARGGDLFGVVKSSPYYDASKFTLILGVQSATPGTANIVHNASATHDRIAVAPYLAGRVDSFANNEELFGPLFAEPEFWTQGTGFLRTMYNNFQSSTHPVGMSIYEVNLHTTQGAISQTALNDFTPSLGAGLATANQMLINMRDLKMKEICLFSIYGYRHDWPDGSGRTSLIWGVLRDPGVTGRKRPHYLAAKLINDVAYGNMIATIQSGDDPTWNQPLMNRISYPNAHHIQSYAFASDNHRGVVIFNFDREFAHDVTFAGSNMPGGTVTIHRLSAPNITDNNETAEHVGVTTTTDPSFDPGAALTLPRYSMTVLSWPVAPQLRRGKGTL